MLGATSAWLSLAGVVERVEATATVASAMEARWTAEGRGDVASVSLLPRGRSWYIASAREPVAAHRSSSRSSSSRSRASNVSTLIGTTVQTRQKELAIRASLGAGRFRLLATAAGRASGARGARWRGRWTPRHLDGARSGAADGQSFHTRRPRRLAGPEGRRSSPSAWPFAVAAAIGVMPALRWSRVNTLPALQGYGARLDARLPIHRSLVVDSLAGGPRHGAARVGRPPWEDRLTIEARHPGVGAGARVVCWGDVRHLRTPRRAGPMLASSCVSTSRCSPAWRPWR